LERHTIPIFRAEVTKLGSEVRGRKAEGVGHSEKRNMRRGSRPTGSLQTGYREGAGYRVKREAREEMALFRAPKGHHVLGEGLFLFPKVMTMRLP
jgi:hypothetical protein